MHTAHTIIVFTQKHARTYTYTSVHLNHAYIHAHKKSHAKLLTLLQISAHTHTHTPFPCSGLITMESYISAAILHLGFLGLV